MNEPRTKQGRAKYRNKVVNNVFGRFDSIKEFKRYLLLREEEKIGRIKNLQRQVKFELIPKQTDSNGKLIERACYYIADFVYEKQGKQVVEDVKSRITVSVASFVIKRKLMLYKHNISIKEV